MFVAAKSFDMKTHFVNLRGALVKLDKPLVAGILNLTPDSFFDGGKYNSTDAAKLQIEKMINQGADIIDIGAMSSRPGADILDKKEEWERLKPVLEIVKKSFPDLIFSVDTIWADIAEKSICEYGAAIINDISGGEFDSEIMKVSARYKIPYILMHMRGTPKNMNSLTQYNDVVSDVIFELTEKLQKIRDLGVNDIFIDPGFGFAKNIEQNYELLSNLEKFKVFELPIYVGLSRKSMAWRLLGISQEESLYATQTINTIALLKGASIIRVHDVEPARQAIDINNMIGK